MFPLQYYLPLMRCSNTDIIWCSLGYNRIQHKMIIFWHIKVTTATLQWIWIHLYTFYEKLWRTACCKNRESKQRDCIEIRCRYMIDCYTVSKADLNLTFIRTDASNTIYLFVFLSFPTVWDITCVWQTPTSCSEWIETILCISGIINGQHCRTHLMCVNSTALQTSTKDLSKTSGRSANHSIGWLAKNLEKWGNDEQAAFEKLKGKSASSLVLSMWDFDLPTCMKTDAFCHATGGVLEQKHADGVWHPVAYLSEGMMETKCNYKIYNWELLAVVRALETWCYYLKGLSKKFTIFTNHKNLEH